MRYFANFLNGSFKPIEYQMNFVLFIIYDFYESSSKLEEIKSSSAVAAAAIQ